MMGAVNRGYDQVYKVRTTILQTLLFLVPKWL
jgi:hypothetical protein